MIGMDTEKIAAFLAGRTGAGSVRIDNLRKLSGGASSPDQTILSGTSASVPEQDLEQRDRVTMGHLP